MLGSILKERWEYSIFKFLINLFLATPHSVQDLSSELSPSAVEAQSLHRQGSPYNISF